MFPFLHLSLLMNLKLSFSKWTQINPLDLMALALPFIKEICNLCRMDDFVATTSWLKSGYFPPQVNSTIIVLIPKLSLKH